MNIIDGKDYKSEFVKAIYYLNSHYFKSIDYFVTLNKLSIEIDEEFDYFDKDDPTKIFKSLKRTRHVVRKDLLKQEPLNLYNSAMNYEGESRFLLLYRVLEFFMNEALKKLSEKLRYDNSISSEELIIKLSIRDEEAQLQNLLSNVTSAKEKAKLSKFCKETELISLENFNKIGSKLYSFRNSIVHAKEKEIERTRFPNPFENNDEVRNWNNVLDLIARKSIMKLNM